MTRKQVQTRVNALASETRVLAERWRSLVDDMQDFFDERSEQWQMGDKGDEWLCLIEDVEALTDDVERAGDFEVEE